MNFTCAVSFRLGFCFVLVLACRGEKPAANSDSSSTGNSRRTIPGLVTTTGWDSTAGSFVAIPAPNDSADAALVLPGLTDSILSVTKDFEINALDNAALDLFSLRGLVGHAAVRVSSQPRGQAGCWPSVRLSGFAPVEWKIGLESGKAKGFKVNPIGAEQSQDSAALTADVLGIASQIPQRDDAAFKGIPYSVRNAYRVSISESSLIIAEVVRKINEEANPREEHVFLIGERQPPAQAFHLTFHKKSAGAEESLETTDLLSVIQIVKTGKPALIVSFDYEDGRKLGLIERFSESTWRLVWKSAYAGC